MHANAGPLLFTLNGAAHLGFLLPPRHSKLLQQRLPQRCITAAAATLSCPAAFACCVLGTVTAFAFILNDLNSDEQQQVCGRLRRLKLSPTANVQLTAGEQPTDLQQ
jgi:hypothetical protein